MSARIAIVAGRGALPGAIASALRAEGQTPLFAVMKGAAPDLPEDVETVPFRVEKLGALFKALRAAHVGEVVFAGGMARPQINPAQFDLKTMALAPKFLGAMKGGDDGLLRVIVSIFEGEGLRVRAAHDIAPSLLPEPGCLTSVSPSPEDRADVQRAAAIVRGLSSLDIGQGAVVAQGLALGVEALPGTDALLAQVAAVADGCRPDPKAARGVLFKGPKTGQDRRVDLPAIGPGTIDGAAQAGLAGIAIAAGGVMVLDRSQTLAAAEAAGLFLWVVPDADLA